MFSKEDEDAAVKAMIDILSRGVEARKVFDGLADAALMCIVANFTVDPKSFPRHTWVIDAAHGEIKRRGQPALYWRGPAHKTAKILHPREERVPFHKKPDPTWRSYERALRVDTLMYQRHLLAGPETDRYAVVMVLETDPPPSEWPKDEITEAWLFALKIGALQ